MEVIYDISILYLEDDEGVRDSIERVLGLMFKNVAVASNGLEALEKLKNAKFDIIVTDIRMPKMDGFEFIAQMKADGLNIPVVITSAFNETEYLLKAIELKVDKFILKPIKMNSLLEAVSTLSKTIINERELLKKRLELEHYRSAVEHTNLVIKSDVNGIITHINSELKEYFGLFNHAVEIPPTLVSLLKNSEVEKIIANAKEMKICSLLTTLSLETEIFSVQLTAFPSRYEGSAIEEITILLNNITHVVKEKDLIIQSLYIDQITKLPNRAKLMSDLVSAENIGLIIIDIDNFSYINYLFGMEVGDMLLKQLGAILESLWSDKEERVVAYRVEADHFAVIVHSAKSFVIDAEITKIEAFGRNIQEHDFTISDGSPIKINFSMGVSFTNSLNIFTETIIALDHAKKSKKAFICFNHLDSEEINNYYRANFDTNKILQTAVQEGNITCYYQPIYDAKSCIVKYEALMRIHLMDEENTTLYPAQFMEIAYNSKFYPQMSKIVISKALKDFEGSLYGVSVNVSYADISNGEVVQFLLESIKKYSNTKITVELLESESLKDMQKTIDFCHLIKDAGADIAIDDFGTGYSNFGYFIDMPIDYLKLDGSLVKRIHEYRGYLAVESIVLFAKKLDIKIVAEYVESEEDFLKLQTLGVDLFQGYYFSSAKPFSEIEHGTKEG